MSKKKNKPVINWINIEDQEKSEWTDLCPPNEYRVISSQNLPNALSSGLVNKYNSVFIMASGSYNDEGTVYYMANGNRVDKGEIDQMPFGIAFIGSEPYPSGCLVQHADHVNRTIVPDDTFWDHISESGINSRYPISELPANDSGSIEDLNISSQQEAFSNLVKTLKEEFEE